MTDVGKTNIVAQIKVEHAESYTASNAQTAVKTLKAREIAIRYYTQLRCCLFIFQIFSKSTNFSFNCLVFNVAIYAYRQISTK